MRMYRVRSIRFAKIGGDASNQVVFFLALLAVIGVIWNDDRNVRASLASYKQQVQSLTDEETQMMKDEAELRIEITGQNPRGAQSRQQAPQPAQNWFQQRVDESSSSLESGTAPVDYSYKGVPRTGIVPPTPP